MPEVGPTGGVRPVEGTVASSKTKTIDISKPSDLLVLGIIVGNADLGTAREIEAIVSDAKNSGSTKVSVPTLEVVTNRKVALEAQQVYRKLEASVKGMLKN